MGRNKIKIEKIENDRVRQVQQPVLTTGHLLQAKKRTSEESYGTVSSVPGEGVDLHHRQK